MPDRILYRDPRRQPKLASPSENERVIGLLHEEIEAAVQAHVIGGDPDEADYGHARGNLARDWVELARHEGWRVPGEEQRAQARRLEDGTPDPEDVYRRNVSAAEACIRNLLEGRYYSDWQLSGIESAIARRHGRPFPPSAYQQQEKML